MESHGDDQPKYYYSVLGLRNDAPACAIRGAYLKLAMEWHPDKCNSQDGAKAKAKFQEIQEAYAVLSDENKKFLYDNGLYDPEDDEEDIVGFTSFMNEMSEMMMQAKTSEVILMPTAKGAERTHESKLHVALTCHLRENDMPVFHSDNYLATPDNDLATPFAKKGSAIFEESTGGGSNFEELQQLFESMFSGDLASFSNRKSSL